MTSNITNNITTLYYIHDPMCSWCWGFKPVWQEIRQSLPNDITLKYLLGGLAADSNETMPLGMQQDIAGYWRKIQSHIPNTAFNFDFWEQCEPRRSTYPSCRAVIAARKQQALIELVMIEAIQKAYYLQAKNPSDNDTLIKLAKELGLDEVQFATDLSAPETQIELETEIRFAQEIGAQGFPSMVLEKNLGNNKKHHQLVPLNYNDPKPALDFIEQVLSGSA